MHEFMKEEKRQLTAYNQLPYRMKNSETRQQFSAYLVKQFITTNTHLTCQTWKTFQFFIPRVDFLTVKPVLIRFEV
jgi:hypothetical protein